MKKTRKSIDLEQSIIDALSIQAIKTGNRNFKQHVEKILIEHARQIKN